MTERNPSVVELSAKKFVKSHNCSPIIIIICRPVMEQRPVLSVVTVISRFGMEPSTVHLVTRMEKTALQNSLKSLA